MTAGELPPVTDEGNRLLEGVNSELVVGTIEAADGRLLGVATVRTTSVTVTVFLDPADVLSWAGTLSGLHDRLTGAPPRKVITSGLVVAGSATPGQLDLIRKTVQRQGNGHRS
jgi:hypothetical protein